MSLKNDDGKLKIEYRILLTVLGIVFATGGMMTTFASRDDLSDVQNKMEVKLETTMAKHETRQSEDMRELKDLLKEIRDDLKKKKDK